MNAGHFRGVPDIEAATEVFEQFVGGVVDEIVHRAFVQDQSGIVAGQYVAETGQQALDDRFRQTPAPIDRATTDATRIGDGTKIDNLVQIGHNVVLGRHCIIVAQVGISGSTELEDYCVVGGQAGIVGHVRLGRGVQVGAQSGVTKSIKAGAKVNGTPAEPLALSLRLHALLRRLPEWWNRTKALEARVERLEQREQDQKEALS